MIVGTTLGPYQILEEIGRGGMATVYRARQVSMERDVAIKMIHRGANDPDAAQRFQREARLIARLEHPHILPVYDFDGAHDPPYIVTRCLDGGTLEDVLARGAPPLNEAAGLVRQICSALDYAHRQGVIHRDIKPANILIDLEGNAFVSDFGIARLLNGPSSMRITQKGIVLGSVEYMSPEQALGKSDLDHRSDLYSLGVMLFQILTGALPFVSDPPLGVLAMHLQQPVPSARAIQPELPEAVDAVLCRAMAKNREERYRSAIELAAALDAALGLSAFPGTGIPLPVGGETSWLREAAALNTPLSPEQADPTFKATLAEQNRPVVAVCANAAEYAELCEAGEVGSAARHRMIELWECFEGIVNAGGGQVFSRTDTDLLAVWGVDIFDEDHAERAVRAALAMQAELRARLRDLDQAECQRWEEELPLNIGVHCGMALLSPLALPDARTGAYGVTGATISLANRLMQAAYGTVLITHDVYRRVRGVFEIQPDLPMRVRGRSEGVPTYRVTAAKPRAFRPATRGVAGVETRMVGRETEIKRLQHAFLNAVEDAETQVVTISGEAGLGKSRLLDAFDQWCELRPEMYFLFRGRAGTSTGGHAARPYALLRDLLAFRFQIRGDDPPQLIAEKLESGLAALLGPSADSPPAELAHPIGHLCGFDFSYSGHARPLVRPLLGDPARLVGLARAAITRLFLHLSRSDTVLIQLEDLHLADDASLDLLDKLFNALAASRADTHLIAVCTARPELYQRRPGWGRAQPFHTRLDLQPLDRRESRELARELLKQVPEPPRALRDLLVERSAGNPYSMEELVRLLHDDRVIVPEGESVCCVQESRLSGLSVPPSLSGLLEARLDTLLAPEKLVLQRAAVCGRAFYDGTLQAIDEAEVSAHGTGVHIADLPGVLAALVRREFIHKHEHNTLRGAVEYTFAQALLREAVLDGLPELQRVIYQKAVARWVEER